MKRVPLGEDDSDDSRTRGGGGRLNRGRRIGTKGRMTVSRESRGEPRRRRARRTRFRGHGARTRLRRHAGTWVAAVMLLTLVPAVPAQAVNCSSQQQVFTKINLSVVFVENGEQGRIRRSPNRIASSCSQDWNVNTINFLFSSVQGIYYEVGFYEFSDTGQGDWPPHRIHLFSEYMVPPSVSFLDHQTCGTINTDINKYLGFRIERRSGSSTSWSAKINCEDGGGFHTVNTRSTGFSSGYSRGEWERFPDTNGFSTLHKDLLYKDYRLVWRSWPGVLCSGDTTPGVQLHVISNTSWNLWSGSGGC